MLSIKIQALELSLYEMESELKESRRIMDELRRAAAFLSTQKGLEREVAALKNRIRKVEEQADDFKRLILVLGRAIQLYRRNEDNLINAAETTLTINRKLRFEKIEIDPSFFKMLGVRTGDA